LITNRNSLSRSKKIKDGMDGTGVNISPFTWYKE
jgi:hypothetical protein